LCDAGKHINGYSFGVDGNLMDEGTAYYINLSDLKEATNNFSRKIGKGSFGSVYYGKMKDGKEIAVKTMTDPSSHGNHQFATEVELLAALSKYFCFLNFVSTSSIISR
jgi:predicted Ser/Thr protein kinase